VFTAGHVFNLWPCFQLMDGELKLFPEVSPAVPEKSIVLTYAKLHLKTTSRAKPTSRSLLRDNSGMMCKESIGFVRYGELHNVAIIQHLLSKDLQGFRH